MLKNQISGKIILSIKEKVIKKAKKMKINKILKIIKKTKIKKIINLKIKC